MSCIAFFLFLEEYNFWCEWAIFTETDFSSGVWSESEHPRNVAIWTILCFTYEGSSHNYWKHNDTHYSYVTVVRWLLEFWAMSSLINQNNGNKNN